jgi:hypothetical protein
MRQPTHWYQQAFVVNHGKNRFKAVLSSFGNVMPSAQGGCAAYATAGYYTAGGVENENERVECFRDKRRTPKLVSRRQFGCRVWLGIVGCPQY